MKRFIPLKKYSLYITAGLMVVIIIIFLFAGNRESGNERGKLKGNKDIQVTLEDKQEKNDNDSSSIFVEVKGAVKKPGVYSFQSGARVEEAIRRAGGFTSKADTLDINQAAKLEDSMMIYVRKQGEIERATQTQTAATDIPSDIEKSQAVNVNQADAAELQTINGIGPAKAEAIITYREEHGEFQQIEDLRNISGFGEKTIERLKSELTVK
ncbi:helix-hairpin-helix domain-containing protein [Bacillus pumilus]|uniref:helix-hairpin-helix domain-containing protein n=1 Tax=Bacillus pumilus TaxID=1408 RepID=UPI0011E929D9|nr:helix-hairpin-helix domain-containing protein [Bacillus pumilus]TYS36767.1 competence protein ComEA [Bacillus pumilus]TYS53573.1 competence protein ComEA [Bacillus pumilus]